MGRLPEDVNNGGFSPDFGKTVWHMAVGLILGWWCCRLSMRLQYFFGRPPWQAPWTLSCLLQAVLPALSFAASVLHHLVGADCLLRRACGGHAAAPHLCKQVRAVAPSCCSSSWCCCQALRVGGFGPGSLRQGRCPQASFVGPLVSWQGVLNSACGP